MDFVFVLDLVLAFRTPYQKKDGALVTSCGGIGWHYLRTWFLVDFLAVFPFDLGPPLSQSLSWVVRGRWHV